MDISLDMKLVLDAVSKINEEDIRVAVVVMNKEGYLLLDLKFFIYKNYDKKEIELLYNYNDIIPKKYNADDLEFDDATIYIFNDNDEVLIVNMNMEKSKLPNRLIFDNFVNVPLGDLAATMDTTPAIIFSLKEKES